MMIMSPVTGFGSAAFKSNIEQQSLPTIDARHSSNEETVNSVLNEMSRQVLMSIEALSIADRDGGECLRRVLCESNKYSRTLSGSQKIWLPLWR